MNKIDFHFINCQRGAWFYSCVFYVFNLNVSKNTAYSDVCKKNWNKSWLNVNGSENENVQNTVVSSVWNNLALELESMC